MATREKREKGKRVPRKRGSSTPTMKKIGVIFQGHEKKNPPQGKTDGRNI